MANRCLPENQDASMRRYMESLVNERFRFSLLFFIAFGICFGLALAGCAFVAMYCRAERREAEKLRNETIAAREKLERMIDSTVSYLKSDIRRAVSRGVEIIENAASRAEHRTEIKKFSPGTHVTVLNGHCCGAEGVVLDNNLDGLHVIVGLCGSDLELTLPVSDLSSSVIPNKEVH